MHSPQPKPANAQPLPYSMELGKPLLGKVDVLILDIIKEEIPLIHDIAEHIITSGGKRLRPLLTLICSMVCSYEGDRHIRLAAAVEFIHTATLLHDDVVDESGLRRGLSTANEVWGNKPSVLVGDFLLSQAFRLMVKDGSLDILDILSNAAAIISKGEVLQLSTENQLDTSLDLYLEVVRAKTAELFAAACEIAPVMAGRDELRPVFRQYGMALGIAFQAVDDVLDYAADPLKLGKSIGDDFKEKKVTLPVILLRDALGEQDRQRLQTFFVSDYQQQPEDIAQMQRWLADGDIYTQCHAFIEAYCVQAREAIRAMPESPATKALVEIVEYGVSRVS